MSLHSFAEDQLVEQPAVQIATCYASEVFE
jgi:hypothetical protein